MSNLLYVIAVVFTIFWAISFFIFHIGIFIHMLLIIPVLAILFKILKKNKTHKYPSFKPMVFRNKK